MSRSARTLAALLLVSLPACDRETPIWTVDASSVVEEPSFAFGEIGEFGEIPKLAPYSRLTVFVSRLSSEPVEASRFESRARGVVADWIVDGPERVLDRPVRHPEHGDLRSIRERFVLVPTRQDLDSLPDLLIGERRFTSPSVELDEPQAIDPVGERTGQRIEEEPRRRGFWAILLQLVFLLGPLLVFLSLVKREGRSRDRRPPAKRARERILEAEHPAVIHRAIRDYLQEEYEHDTAGRTSAEVLALLKDDGRFGEPERVWLTEMFETCDQASFAARRIEASELEQLQGSASAFCVPEGEARERP